MTMVVPFLDLVAAHAELAEPLDRAWARILGATGHTLGPEVEAFEEEFARYCGVRHCIGVASGLDALTLILRAADIGRGHEVIVPIHTFIATWLAVSHCGATPVGVDCEPAGFNIDPTRIEEMITPATRAIIAVHLYGHPAAMDALREIASRYGLMVIEDAAQSHGARWHGRRTGSLGNAAAFSFYPSKNLGALGDGGAVTTSDDGLAERIRLMRNYGQRGRYHHVCDGYNSRLDALQAAVLRVKLEVLDSWQRRRSDIAIRYRQEISGDVVLPAVADQAEHAWHLFVVRARNRTSLQQRLAKASIESVVHYPLPCHRQPIYAACPSRIGGSERADRLSREVLSLPIGPHLGPDQIDRVIAAVNGG